MFDNFETKVNHGNTWLGTIKSSVFFDLPVCIPNIQRIRDDDKVSDIISYQCDFFQASIFNTMVLSIFINVLRIK